jgi:hypothetical protein
MSDIIGQYIGYHIIFDATQNGVVVAQFDLTLSNFLYNLYVGGVGYVTSLGRR